MSMHSRSISQLVKKRAFHFSLYPKTAKPTASLSPLLWNFFFPFHFIHSPRISLRSLFSSSIPLPKH